MFFWKCADIKLVFESKLALIFVIYLLRTQMKIRIVEKLCIIRLYYTLGKFSQLAL